MVHSVGYTIGDCIERPDLNNRMRRSGIVFKIDDDRIGFVARVVLLVVIDCVRIPPDDDRLVGGTRLKIDCALLVTRNLTVNERLTRIDRDS
jgi:hypothetical protein